MLHSPWLQFADKLSLLDSHDIVRRLYFEKHDRKLNEQQSREIVSNISQGRAYFDSAKTSDLIVRPLLQYYGVLALARAAILLSSRNIRETALAASHGLGTPDWKGTLSAGTENWLTGKLRVENGTFTQFEQVVGRQGHWEISRGSGGPLRLRGGVYDALSHGCEFSVLDVVSRMPQVAPLLEELTAHRAMCWDAHALIQGARCQITVSPNKGGLPSRDEMNEWFAVSGDDRLDETIADYVDTGVTPILEHRFTVDDTPRMLQKLKHLHPLGNCLVAPLATGETVNPLALTFAAAFALGMFVRYHPGDWMGVLGHQRGDVLLPLTREISDSTARFPSDLLEAL